MITCRILECQLRTAIHLRRAVTNEQQVFLEKLRQIHRREVDAEVRTVSSLRLPVPKPEIKSCRYFVIARTFHRPNLASRFQAIGSYLRKMSLAVDWLRWKSKLHGAIGKEIRYTLLICGICLLCTVASYLRIAYACVFDTDIIVMKRSTDLKDMKRFRDP